MTKLQLPWQQIMKFGLLDLRLSPEQFWNTTIKELLIMRGSDPSITREELTELMQKFPDL